MNDAAKKVLREGFFPQFHTERLEALLPLLETDSPLITTGLTCVPSPLKFCADWPVEQVCPIAFCSTEAPFQVTVAYMEEAFNDACIKAKEALGDPTAVRYILNAIDDGDRKEVFRELAQEIREELQRRAAGV